MFKKYTEEEFQTAIQNAHAAGRREYENKFKLEKDELVSQQTIDIKEIKAAHAIELREKEFDIRHNNDDEKQKLTVEITEVKTKLAVAEEKIIMLDKIVDLNADVIDVKELVTNLINKLPTINLTSLPSTTTNITKTKE